MSRGFKPISLLTVLVVLVIISAVGIYLWNPLERARESRDRQRLSALEELNKAIKIYLRNNSSSPTLCNSCALGLSFFASSPITINSKEALVVSSVSVNGTGWVPLDLSLNADIGKTPLLILPQDPINKDPFVYTYSPGEGGNFKLTTSFESKAFYNKMVDDKGVLPNRYEIGTNLSLPPN